MPQPDRVVIDASAVVAADVGAARLPLAPGPTGEPFPDIALDILAQFLANVLTRYGGAAWEAVAPGEPIVRNYFTHDPEQYDFKLGDLPALYIFRTGSAKDPEQITADLRTNTDKVMVQWVLPPTDQLKQPGRARAMALIAHWIDSSLRRGRDPSFVVEGDPDPTAAVHGSVVIRHAGLMRIDGGKWHAGQIAIRKFGGSNEREVFPAMLAEFMITEVFDGLPGTSVPDALGPTAKIVFPARVSAVVTPNGSDETAVEYRDPLTLATP